MKTGWLADEPGYLGGAEMTQAEFLTAAPVEIVKCKPGEVIPGLDCYIAHNVVHYSLSDLLPLRGASITWFHHDLSPWINPEVKAWLDAHADHIFCSPLHRKKYGGKGVCIPPALDLAAFESPRQSKKRREGICSMAQWRAPGKGAWLLEEWAAENGPVDVYGDGPCPPIGQGIDYKGPLAPDKVAQTLWRYETFVFLPAETEPFCRGIAEAHAAGCAVITNRHVGATYWLQEKPEALETAAEDFWAAALPKVPA